MELGLTDRTVVVTGASKGIGLACAHAFAAEGARVAIVSRSRANLDAALGASPRAKHGMIAIAADLVRIDEAKRAIDEAVRALGPIDVLVNSAGAARRYPPDELSAQGWHDAMDAKFFSYIHPTDLVVKAMAARGRGAIVNIVGQGGKVASPVHLPGGAANAALMLATVGLAAAYAPKGVRVNAINPGSIKTERLDIRLKSFAEEHGIDIADAERQMAKSSGVARFGQPSEIAAAVAFLASPQCGFCHGALLDIDGGQTRTL